MTQLKDTEILNLEALDYSRLEDAEDYLLELVTPFVLESEYPGTDEDSVLWWYVDHDDGLRRREERLVEQREAYRLKTVDRGKVVGYDGDTPIKTAKTGVVRIGCHSKYGFGQFRVKPITGETTRDTQDRDGND